MVSLKDEEIHPLNENKDRQQQPKKFDFAEILKYVSLIILVVQNAGQVLIIRYATTRPEEKFLKTVAVLFTEIIKLLSSFILLSFSNNSIIKSLKDLKYYFITNIFDTIKVGVPAFIYTLQNFILYVAVENLETATFMVSYQIKILTTAAFTVLMLKRKLSLLQWISLIILICGVALVQLNAKQDASLNATINDSNNETLTTTTMSAKHAAAKSGNPVIGFAAVMIACIMSGFAGIYFEKILKGSNVSLWMRNIQLAGLSIPIACIMILAKDRVAVEQKGLIQGFDWVVWMVVLTQAVGGLVVAIVIKYADNILKAFATSIAIIVGTIAAIYFFDSWPKPLFLAGGCLVIIAVVIYSKFPYKTKSSSSSSDVEMMPVKNSEN